MTRDHSTHLDGEIETGDGHGAETMIGHQLVLAVTVLTCHGVLGLATEGLVVTQHQLLVNTLDHLNLAVQRQVLKIRLKSSITKGKIVL